MQCASAEGSSRPQTEGRQNRDAEEQEPRRLGFELQRARLEIDRFTSRPRLRRVLEG